MHWSQLETQAFIHPKTARSKELIKQIVDEVRSHKEIENISFTSIQINHNTINAPTPTTTSRVFLRSPSAWAIALADASVLLAQNSYCTYATTLSCLMGLKPTRQASSTATVGHLNCCSCFAATAPAAFAGALRKLGLPCPPTTSSFLLATVDAKPSPASAGMDSGDYDAPPAKAGWYHRFQRADQCR